MDIGISLVLSAYTTFTLSTFTGELQFVDAKTVLIHAGDSPKLHLRSYPECRTIATIDVDRQRPWELAVADGVIAVATTEGELQVWAGPRWERRWRVPFIPGGDDIQRPDRPLSLALSPDRSELAVGSERSRVHMYRVRDGKLLRSADRTVLAVRNTPLPAYSPDGRDLVIGSDGYYGDPSGDSCGMGFLNPALTRRWACPTWGGAEFPRACYYTPDGRTVVVSCWKNRVRFFEAETGGLRLIAELPCYAWSMAVSPDGRLLAVADSRIPKAHVFDWRAGRRTRHPDADVLDALWDALASPNSAKAFGAMSSLGGHPEEAAKLIGERLKPVPMSDAAAVKRLVADLGSDDFAEREAAEAGLAKLGEAVIVELRAGAKSEQAEQRARAEKLLRTAERRDNPERLRYLRAVEVLEYADTPAGRDVLKNLAAGAPGAGLTRDANAALARLGEVGRNTVPGAN